MKNRQLKSFLFVAVAAILVRQAEAEDGHHDEHAVHADEVKLTELAVRQNGIRIGIAEERKLSSSVLAPARIAYNAEAMAHVGSPVSGRVAEIKVKVGARVKKWDPLLIIESPELGRAQSELLQRYTEANVAAAAVQPAKDSLDRARKLYDESQGISLAELQKREADHRSAAGAAAGAKAALRTAENTLRLLGFTAENVRHIADTGEIDPRFVIRAPMDGDVIDREVTLGELVSPDKDKLLVLANTQTLWVLADVAESRLQEIAVGNRADVLLTSAGADPIQGEVSLISTEIDPTTRTARLRIAIDNVHGNLRPGMFAKALIDGRSGEQAIAVPEDAVQVVEGKSSVFVPVEGEANTFARREVAVGSPSNRYVPVLSGLKAGENVVVSGSFVLKAELGKSEAGHDH